MATYIIGDIQGCFAELLELLDVINFDAKQDRLGFVGDLVNRGPKSLETLRFIADLSDPLIVLGNHDINLLAIYFGFRTPSNHSLNELLTASDLDELIEFLIAKPFMIQNQNYVMVHAGIPPQWTIEQAQSHADEASKSLQKNPELFLKNIFGDQPEIWRDDLIDWNRYRYIINSFTRMRFCDESGRLDMQNTTMKTEDANLKPWFDWRKNDAKKIIFGHWASLEGNCQKPDFYALDTGAVWGGKLTAIRVDDWQLFSNKSQKLIL